MSRSPASSVLAWSLWSCWLVLTIVTIGFGGDLPHHGDYPLVLALVGYATVGALAAARQPGNAVGWLLLVAALALSVSIVGDTYVITMSNPGYVAVAWLTSWLVYVGWAIVAIFLPLCFPTGRLLSPRWRAVWWFALVTTVVGILPLALAPGHLAVNAPIDNPLAVRGTAQRLWEVMTGIVPYAVTAALILSIASLVLRFRRSRGVERQQLKWFTYAALLPFTGLALSGVGELLLPEGTGQIVNDVGWIVFVVASALGIPIATGIAILRYRLYDIDVVINRTLVYGALTAALLVVYVGSILVLRVLLSPLTGDNDLAVAGSTLAVAALFRPARARIQAVVDRRFYRRKYDATQTLNAFSNQLSHVVDIDEIGSELRSVVTGSVQPRHISLWLRR
ncbi:hypothetical protein [Nocardioides sp.]|uniref:hypothetical protein n=1 Tax=Nocardioides sp. TaxID=35761 RepID=UPI002ECFB4D2